MKVHISRSIYELIYELIYDGAFNVKERGKIQFKYGKVITYLVE
jgi:hypothetical protein